MSAKAVGYLTVRWARTFGVVVMVALTACAGSSAAPSTVDPPQEPSSALALNPSAWETISEPAAFPLRNDGSGHLLFDFPTTGSINYLYNVRAPRVIAGSLTLTVQVTTNGPAVFDFMTEPFNTCTTPASVRPLIWSNRNGFGDYDRWWAQSTVYVLGPGSATLTIPLAGEQWSNVNGALGSADAATRAGFAAALRNVSSLGVTFGGGCFFGHGVRVPQGSATFTLVQYSVRP